jgi:hypothetical protein
MELGYLDAECLHASHQSEYEREKDEEIRSFSSQVYYIEHQKFHAATLRANASSAWPAFSASSNDRELKRGGA